VPVDIEEDDDGEDLLADGFEEYVNSLLHVII
jgi:hypothetical protein